MIEPEVKKMLNGVGASSGIGLGNVVCIKENSVTYNPHTPEDVNEEIARFENAVNEYVNKTMLLADDVKTRIGEKESEILMGHIMMISDPSLTSEVKDSISAGSCAEEAVDKVCTMFAEMFSSTGDELIAQRSSDVNDIKTGILKILLNIEEVDLSKLPPKTIIVAQDLTPSQTAMMNKENVTGIITEAGGKTSHSAILAKALEIPAVLSVPYALENLADGEFVIINGITGEIFTDPSDEQVKEYTAKYNAHIKERRELEKFRGKASVTKKGRKVELLCNIASPDDAQTVLERDGEGVGLMRTEFLFMKSDQLPTEEEQFEAYKKVALIMRGKPVIIRTLDIGGDKALPYLGLEKEDNPFLGFRAIRFCLSRTDIYRTQLRALLRASAYGDIRIMIPLITCVEEVVQSKKLIHDIMTELDKDKIEYNKDIKIGIMIETPASSIIADLLAQESDFFSIGTNDLTQYTMVVDRGNAKVGYLYSPMNVAVLRSVEHIIKCAKKAGIPVGMCGEAAAEPEMIPKLIEWGLDEFSVSPTSVLEVRKVISQS